MLLSHTAGLPSSSSYFGRHDPSGLEAYVREQIPTREFVAPPGKLYSYSNDGLVVAGYLAEVVSGQSFPDLMQALVFDPLEMKRTTYDPAVAMTYPLAQEHEWLEDGTVRVLHRFVNNTAYAPAGPQPMSTVLDLANFAIMHLNQGRFRDKQLLSAASVKTMQTNQVAFHTLKDEGYGLTLRTETYKGKHLMWHNGLARATTSIFCLMPEERIAVMMLFNGLFAGFGASTFVYTLFDQLLHLSKKEPEIQPIEPEKSLWSGYAGIYISIGSGGLATILLKDDCLVLDLNGIIIPLNALRQDFYVGQDPQTNAHIAVYFLPEEEGPTQYMTVDGRAHHRFEQDSSFVPRPTDWKQYVGTYTGNNGTIKIHIEGEHLRIHSVDDKREEIGVPLDQTRFVSTMGIIEFLQADDGTASELLLHNAFHYPRVK
jgi:Beta-lactamase